MRQILVVLIGLIFVTSGIAQVNPQIPDTLKPPKVPPQFSGAILITERDDCEGVKVLGEVEGKKETNGFAWGTLGFLFPLPSFVVAAAVDPGKPSYNSLSKYSLTTNRICFENGYRNKKKSERFKATAIGAGIGIGLFLLIRKPILVLL